VVVTASHRELELHDVDSLERPAARLSAPTT